MNNIIIYLFILIANVVAIFLVYHSFDKNVEKTKKLIYTMIAMGIMYIAILIIYFFSSIGLDKEATKQAKDMITFAFVPVNSIILLPFLIRSFNQGKNRQISTEQLNRRAIFMIILAVILVVGEFFYFRNITKGIIEIANQKQNTANSEIQENTTTQENVEMNKEITNDDVLNRIVNDL